MTTLVKAKGLNTFNNELSVKEGSLLTADNIIIDRDDIIKPRRGVENYGSVAPCCGSYCQIIDYKDRILVHDGCTLYYDCCCNAGTFTAFAGTYNVIESGIRMKSVESNGNLYFTTSNGVKKISGTLNSSCQTNFTCAANFIDDAGGPKALDVTGNVSYAAGGFLAGLSAVAYRIVWGVRDANNNLIQGSPSSRLVIINTAAAPCLANVCLNFTIPADADNTDYFYAVYRTGIVTACCACTVPCLQPGDEMNQVFEGFVTSCELTSGTVSVQDTAPDCFRESGTLLYTNPVSGDGILQANEKPPIAKDVALFRNSVFYANTSTVQRKQFSLLSVACLTSQQSKFIVGNACRARQYTFVGEAEVTDITTVANCTNSLNGSYILLDSASDERKYMFWFESIACTCVPCAADTVGTIAVKVCLQPNDSAATVACALNTSITSFTDDFTTALCCNVITVTDTKNGNVIDAHNGLTSPGFTFCVTTQGDGQAPSSCNPDGGDVLLSSLASPSQAIDETARSLVNIINRDIATKETTSFTTVAKACLTAGDSFLFSGACDTNQYQFYYDFCCSVCAPTCNQACFTNVKINITCDTTAAQVATTTACVIGGVGCSCIFNTSTCCATITVTNVATGPSTNASDVAGSTGYTFTVSTQGSSGGIVYAYYLSGEDDLPGIILLESRNLSDGEFYLGVQDDCTDITTKFSPTQNKAFSISSMSGLCCCTKIRVTTACAHGYSTGCEVYIYNTTNSILGKYTITNVAATTTFDITATFTATSTGRVFKATQLSDNENYGNRLYYSKPGIPEAVPLVNFIDIGGRDSAIERILALRDNLFVLKEDGVYIITGGSGIFESRLLDNSTFILAPDSAAILNNQIYMLSSQGIATVSDTGVGVVSRPIENKILEVANNRYNYRTASFGLGYESDRSYVIWLPTTTTDTTGTQAYRFNTFNRSWVRWTLNAKAGLVKGLDDKLYLSSGNSSYILQERKTGDRTDFADVSSATSLTACTICACNPQVILSSVSCVSIGDAIVQTQRLTIPKFNRMLRKLDSDAGLTCTNYFSTLGVCPGECIACALQSLHTKLDADDCSVCYTAPACAPSTFAQIRTDFNTIVGEINCCSTVTQYHDYATIGACCTVTYESLITAVCTQLNKVTLSYSVPFIAGAACVHKGINSIVTWAPQHFGDPAILKQVPEGTIVFDGNNFYNAKLAYSTDLSKDFTERTFLGQGTGYWGGYTWNCAAWGGEGTDVPYRTLIPRQKQRCRYITPRFTHLNAREDFTILGMSLVVRPLSTRAYRSLM